MCHNDLQLDFSEHAGTLRDLVPHLAISKCNHVITTSKYSIKNCKCVCLCSNEMIQLKQQIYA